MRSQSEGLGRRRRGILAVALGAFALASVTSGADAHQPEANLGSPDPLLPYRVPSPTVSRAIRGVLPPGGRDYYALEVERPVALTLWLLTPAVGACAGFAPILRIHDGAHDPAVLLPWNGTRWFAARTIVVSEPGAVVVASDPWGAFQHGGERSNSGPYLKPVLGSGTTLISVEAPPDRGGAYTFAPGDLEIPGGWIEASVRERWRTCPQSWDIVPSD